MIAAGPDSSPRQARGSGVRIDEAARRAVVVESFLGPGLACLGLGLLAGCLLFFRPDVHGEVTPLVQLFRVLFPFGFGLAGLAMLGARTRTEFDAASGRFFRSRRRGFRATRFEGALSAIRRIVLEARHETATARDTRASYTRWSFTLSMEAAGERMPLSSWTCRIGQRRPANQPLLEARAAAERLARLIGRPAEVEAGLRRGTV